MYLPAWTERVEIKDIKDFLFIEKMKKINTRETLKLMLKYYIWRTRCSRITEDMELEKFKQYLYNFLRPHRKAKSLDFLDNEELWVNLQAAIT